MIRKELPGVAVIYVSFNDFSSLDPWEMRDPVGALCRRIAFAALKGREEFPTDDDFDSFRQTMVTEGDILSWLGDTPCILLMDELNILEMDEVTVQTDNGSEFSGQARRIEKAPFVQMIEKTRRSEPRLYIVI